MLYIAERAELGTSMDIEQIVVNTVKGRHKEPEHIARKVLGRNDLHGSQRFIYLLDLTSPNGVFLARDFGIRDEDTVYVTEAPYNQFTKVLNAIVAPASTAASIDSLVE